MNICYVKVKTASRQSNKKESIKILIWRQKECEMFYFSEKQGGFINNITSKFWANLVKASNIFSFGLQT